MARDNDSTFHITCTGVPHHTQALSLLQPAFLNLFVLLFALFFVLLFAIHSHAASIVASLQKYEQEVLHRWQHVNEALNEYGITSTASYTGNFLGNLRGGRRRSHAYASDLSLRTDIDLEYLWGLQGLELHLAGSWRSGQDLSSEAIGNTFTVGQIFGGNTIRLAELSLEQHLFNDRFSLLIGRIGMGNDFATSPLYEHFVQAAFNSNPVSLSINLPSLSVDPVSTWGVRAKLAPVAPWSFMSGVYYSDASLGRDSAHGIDFSLRSSAAITAIGQIDYQSAFHTTHTVLPGKYSVGGYYDSGRFADMSDAPPREHHGNYGFYIMAEQTLFREGVLDNQQGLSGFITGTFAPQQDRNPLPFFFLAGLVYEGLLPGRDDDITAVGFAYGQFSPHLADQSFEIALEWSYAIAVSPGLTIQPDVQYILNPSGTKAIADALIIGLQWIVAF